MYVPYRIVTYAFDHVRYSLAKLLRMCLGRFLSWYDQFPTGGATENYSK